MALLPPRVATSRRKASLLGGSWRLALAPMAAVLLAVAGYWLLRSSPSPRERVVWEGPSTEDEIVVALLDASASLFSEPAVLLDLEENDPEMWAALAAEGWGQQILTEPELDALSQEDLENAADFVGGLWG